ncbi:MAG: C_GCAxxG_C_C family protein [Clostridia bacterium]|nr:C_GCAxxG_C_C family protein [Clostridia bacterium]
MRKSERAKELFLSGYNCSQAVFAAFSDEFSIDEKQAFIMASGFGGGMGRLREVCGAFSGIVMVLSLKYGDYEVSDHAKKAELYARIQELAAAYERENGSVICKELLGQGKNGSVPEARTQQYYKKRPCAELVESAARLLEEYLASH